MFAPLPHRGSDVGLVGEMLGVGVWGALTVGLHFPFISSSIHLSVSQTESPIEMHFWVGRKLVIDGKCQTGN